MINLKKTYFYELPRELIAERPSANPRLLVYQMSTKKISHHYFADLPELFKDQNVHLIFNETKVFPSRIFCQKLSGGKAEIFLLDLVSKEVLIKSRGTKKIGDRYQLPLKAQAVIKSCTPNGTFIVEFSLPSSYTLINYINEVAKLPIPPYIRSGESDDLDLIDYQTSFAKELGSVAAPTAGLHFTSDLRSKLPTSNHFVTLHVGMGTFKPLTSELLSDHHMHTERFMIKNEELNSLQRMYSDSNAKIIPVGTTSLRVLASIHEKLQAKKLEPDIWHETNIFIRPPEKITCVSGLITNFHLPESTLFVLVCAMIGIEETHRVYHEAIQNKYRFFSYGDGMLIIP